MPTKSTFSLRPARIAWKARRKEIPMGKNYRVSFTGASASQRRDLESSVRVAHEVGSTIRVATVLVAIAAAAGCLARSTAREGISRDVISRDVSAHTIWVIDHGWHTAIVVRRSAVDTTIWPEIDDFPDAAFVEVAWGDREERRLDRQPGRAAVGHVEVSIAPRDLDERRVGKIVDLGPDRRIDGAPPNDDRGMPAVIDDPDCLGRRIATGALASGRLRETSRGHRDGDEHGCSANR